MSPEEQHHHPAYGTIRQRIRKACEPCRQRKVKCDGANPCSLCSGYGYECKYVESRRGRGAAAARRSAVSSTVASSPAAVDSAVSAAENEQSSPSETTPEISRLNIDQVEPQKPEESVFVGSEEQKPMNAALTTRFTRADSAIAFPRSLGLSLEVSLDAKLPQGPPRLHSFAWNIGIRSERLPVPASKIFTFVTLKDVDTYSEIYFSIIHPIFGFLDRADFNQHVKQCWSIQMIDPGMESVVCGIVSLGSLFSATNPFPYENEVVEQGRQALDYSFAHSAMTLSLSSIAGWILRALYLRSTTRPHLSWMASNIAVNIAEAIGLHQELSDIKITRNIPRIITDAELDLRRRTFWVAVSLNRLFATEYGRTRVKLSNIGCRLPATKSGDATLSFIHLTQLLPIDDACVNSAAFPSNPAGYHPSPPRHPNSPTTTQTRLQNPPTYLYNALTTLTSPECVAISTTPPISLFRAEVVFALYRKLRFLRIHPSPSEIEGLLSIIRHALSACSILGADRHPWWTLMGIPFHSVCVLLALNTTEALEMVHEPMATLKSLVEVYDTHLAREGLRTAGYLVDAAERKKRREWDGLSRAVGGDSGGGYVGTSIGVRNSNSVGGNVSSTTPLSGGSADYTAHLNSTPDGLQSLLGVDDMGGKASDPPMFEWPTDLDLGWSAFMELTGPETGDFAMGGFPVGGGGNHNATIAGAADGEAVAGNTNTGCWGEGGWGYG